MLPVETHFRVKRHIQIESEGMRKDISWKQHNKMVVAALVLDKIDFKIKSGTKKQRGLYNDKGINTRRYNTF